MTGREKAERQDRKENDAKWPEKKSSKKKGKLLLEKEKEKQEEKLFELRGDESLINRHKGNKLPWVPDSLRLHLRYFENGPLEPG